MLLAPRAKDPVVLTYLDLRKAVGVVAVGLPFAMAIPWWVVGHHMLETSISGYYYTGMRNLFVGSLCAISMFMLCCRGYDREDEVAGMFSGVCALGVAFLPTPPEFCATSQQGYIGYIHYTFAALLFSTLAYFCLRLFKMSAKGWPLTPQKLQRNMVYTVCGIVIIVSMALIAILAFFKVKYLIGRVGTNFCFESTALISFGIAWLVKGEAFLKDANPGPPGNVTSGTAQPAG